MPPKEDLNAKSQPNPFLNPDPKQGAEKIATAATLANVAYTPQNLPAGFRILLDSKAVCSKEESRWFQAYVVQDMSRPNEIYLTFRGSTTRRDFLVTDRKILTEQDMPPIVVGATQRFTERVLHDYRGWNITFTGHSLGGSESNLMSMRYQIPSIAFDAMAIKGVQEKYFPGHGNYSLVTNISSHPTFINVGVEKESAIFYRVSVPLSMFSQAFLLNPERSVDGDISAFYPAMLAHYVTDSHSIDSIEKTLRAQKWAFYSPFHYPIETFKDFKFSLAELGRYCFCTWTYLWAVSIFFFLFETSLQVSSSRAFIFDAQAYPLESTR